MGLKKICPLFFTLVFATLVFGQRHEIGVQVGMSNLVGDIGRTNYILQKPFSDISDFGLPFYAGIIYRMNFNPYQTLRFNLGYSNIQFNDAYAKEDYRRTRYNKYRQNFQGTNSVYNADVQFEYNFFPVNNEQKGMLSPYIFGGIGAIAFSNRRLFVDIGKETNTLADTYVVDPELYNDFKLSIPFGAGLKYKFNYNWALFGELRFRYTFTDNIDYSKIASTDIRFRYQQGDKAVVVKEKNLTQEQKNYRSSLLQQNHIGNPESKDWVNSITLGLSYSFGRPPCYCD